MQKNHLINDAIPLSGDKSSGKKFTFFIPVYNGGSYLQQCVQSILAQTCQDFNITVLDDCSTDCSLHWLTGLCNPSITVIPATQHLGIERTCVFLGVN